MPKRRLSANDKLRLKRLKDHEKELRRQQQKEQRKRGRDEVRRAASRNAARSRQQDSYWNNNLHNACHPIAPSPNVAHHPISPSPNIPTSPSDPSGTNTYPSETNSSIPSINKCINIIKGGNLPPISLHRHPSTHLVQEQFNDFTHNQVANYCHYCKERWCNLSGEWSNDIFECEKHISDRNGDVLKKRALSSENDLHPKSYLINNILPPINDIEEMFLARIHVVMTAFKLEKGALGYKGNVLNMQQDLQRVIDKLPLI